MAWGWTQGQLGQALNTDQTAVSAWERDRVRPSGAALAAICKLMGISVDSMDADEPFQTPAPVPTESHLEGRTISLPPLMGASAILFDGREGQPRRLLDTQEAILKLIEAGRQGRGAWIVLE
jgi:transcriptional regulator with XRE-family HTH domain